MKLGFLTGIMGDVSIYEKIEWASKIGFKTLEVSCWPRVNTRDYSGSDIDVVNFTKEEADRLNAFLKRKRHDNSYSCLL